MKTIQVSVILCVGLLALAAVLPCAAGTFKDRDGATHSWSVDETHALIWEGKPYMPFGVIFEPRVLSQGLTDENWKADEEDVQAFKLAGINDIVIRPAKGLSAATPEAFQKVIDGLEANGLRYGIEVYEPVSTAVVGYVVQPTVNRVDNASAVADASFDFPEADVAIYALCDGRTGEVRDFGRVSVSGGKAKAPVAAQSGTTTVLLYYPRQAASVTGLWSVWNGYDQHRDKLLPFLSQLKFGKGFRLFLDPFGDTFGIRSDNEFMVPTSTIFRYEFAKWLSQKYSSPGDLNIAWAILKHDVLSFDEASRMIPLWQQGRGAPLIYDDGAAKAYPVDAFRSAVWIDLFEFRAASVRSYMDLMADVLKRVAADVPVIYSANGLNGLYQASGVIGYDGIAVPGEGTSAQLFQAAGKTLSMAESASRHIWMISRLRPSGNVYEKKSDLFSSLNAVHDLGAKGFLVSDAKGSGADAANLVSWLGEYANLSVNDKNYAAYRPRVVYYPQNTINAGIKKLSTGAWWLPSLTTGQDLYLGKLFAGYAYNDPRKMDAFVCIWSLKGQQTIHLVSEKPITVTAASGQVTEVKPKKNHVEFAVGEEPLFARGIPEDQFLPIEVVAEAMQDLLDAITRGEQKRMDVYDYKTKMRQSADMLAHDQLALALDLLHEATTDLNRRLRGLEIMPGAGAQ